MNEWNLSASWYWVTDIFISGGESSLLLITVMLILPVFLSKWDIQAIWRMKYFFPNIKVIYFISTGISITKCSSEGRTNQFEKNCFILPVFILMRNGAPCWVTFSSGGRVVLWDNTLPWLTPRNIVFYSNFSRIDSNLRPRITIKRKRERFDFY